jgi:hypothetical protein
MAEQYLVKPIYTGNTITALGEFTVDDTFALTNAPSGIARLATIQNWTAPQRVPIVASNSGTFNMATGQDFTCAPSGSFTLAFTNAASGQAGIIILINPSAYTVSKSSYIKSIDTFLTTVSSAGSYMIGYYCYDATTVYLTSTDALI